VIGVGEPHENGDVESAHGHLRTAIDQALRLRGSRRLGNVAEYEDGGNRQVGPSLDHPGI